MANEEEQMRQPGQPGQQEQQWGGRTNLSDDSERELIVMKLSYSFLQSLYYTMLLAPLFILQQKKTTLENIQSSIGKLPFSNEELKIVATKFKENAINIKKNAYAFMLTISAIVIALAINDTNNVGVKILTEIDCLLSSHPIIVTIIIPVIMTLMIIFSLYSTWRIGKVPKKKWKIDVGLIVTIFVCFWVFYCFTKKQDIIGFYLLLIPIESLTVSLCLIAFSSSLIKKSVHINKYIELEERKATATDSSGANGTTATPSTSES